MAIMINFRLILNEKLRFLKYFDRCRTKIHYLNNLHRYSSNWNASSITVPFASGTKVLSLSTGKLAKFADGCAVATLGETSVMVTSVSKTHVSSSTILPLIVDYKQKAAAAGRIPTNFLRRELGPTEHEILTSRLIDRSLRPLFPDGYCYDTQVMCNILAIDGVNNPDVLAINAASASLAISDIPWNGPVGAVRVGLIDNQVIINPTRYEMQNSRLNLILTAAKQNLVIMLDGCADIILEPDLKKAINSGIKECQGIIQGINKLASLYGKPKRSLDESVKTNDELKESIKSLAEIKLRDIFNDFKHDKLSRDYAIANLRTNILETMKKSVDDLDMSAVVDAFGVVTKEIFRSLMFENDIRCDGRKFNQLRDISCEVNLFKPLHGSSLFQRGQTQVLCTLTLDSLESALKLDTVSMLTSGVKEKNFFLHYEFPPYATKETGKTGPAGRREMGHGALAERGIRPVLPKDYPFTIRLTSEVLESNGSSSMASVCGGSLALLDAGVPITAPVAGVAMGLITKYSKTIPNQIEDYIILTDLLGIEDYLGDMDFKLAGTKKGITAVQLDVKIPGIPTKILMQSITMALTAKSQIIHIMNGTLQVPRVGKENLPKRETIEVPVHQRGRLLGVGGCNLKKIFVETGVSIYPENDNTYAMFAPNEMAMKEAREIIDGVLKEEKAPNLEFGGIYTAKVVEIRENGVMVILYPNMAPALLHVAQLDQRIVLHPSALGINVGDDLQVKYFGRDPVSGAMRLSRRALQATGSVVKNFTSA